MGKGVRPNRVEQVMPPFQGLVVVMEHWGVGRGMEARENGMERCANSVNFAVRPRSDVMERSAGDEGLSAFEEK